MGRLVTFVFCFVVLWSQPLLAAEEYQAQGPFPSRNQHPLYLQNIALSPSRAHVLDPGVLKISVDSSYSSIFERGLNGASLLDLDMELWRLPFRAAYGWRDAIELHLEVPFLHFSGGFLDEFVDVFHRTFGFPRGGRELVDHNRFRYRFDAEGATAFDLPPRLFGVGDVTVGLQHQVLEEERGVPAVAWFFDIKLPTGDRQKGFGSGSPDVGFGALFEKTFWRLHGYLNVGYYAVGGNHVIERFTRDQVVDYAVAGEMTILNNLSLVVQLDGGTPRFHGSGIDALDGIPLDLIIGFRGSEEALLGGHDLVWQVGFAEDVTSGGPSVDFTAFVSLGVRFETGKGYQGDWYAGRRF